MGNIENKYNKWNEQCRKEYDRIFPNVKYTIWDGVIFPEQYAKSSLKIMFLNRESYDPDLTEYDLAETLREELISGVKPIFNSQKKLRQRLKEYLCVVNLIRTGELMSISEDTLMNRVMETIQTDNIFNEMMPSVAYVNVKKSDGRIPSYVTDLRKNTIQGLDILKKQISYFNPSVILAGNVVDRILDYTDVEWGENLYVPQVKHTICIYQLKINENVYPIVDMYHPSATQGWMSMYYLELFRALREVEQSHPNFWKGRINSQCFNG